jgi:hypothetical protein
MSKLEELFQTFKDPEYRACYTHAKATGTCVMCRGPAREFRDPGARFEYGISALCQLCQDKYLQAPKNPLLRQGTSVRKRF